MPTYTFRDKETQETKDVILKYDLKEQYLKDNPNLEQIFTRVPPIGDSIRMGLVNPDAGFSEVLSKIAEKNYRSNLREKLSRN